MSVIGIEINEAIQISTAGLPDGFICCHLIFEAPEGIPPEELNVGKFFTSYSSFTETYRDLKEVVRVSVKAFFENYSRARLWAYPAKVVEEDTPEPPGDGGDGNGDGGGDDNGEDPPETEVLVTPRILIDDLEFCMDILAKSSDFELGFLVIPEFYELIDQEEITSLYSAANALAEFQEWIHLINHTASVQTKEELIAERKPFVSTLGHSAYYGTSVIFDDVTIPITPIVAAIALRRSAEQTVFSPPGGAKYPIQGISDVIPYFSTTNDYLDLKNNDINIVQRIPNTGYCIWGTLTLSADDVTDNKFGEINSRMAVSITIKRLEVALIPLLFESVDPGGFTSRDVIRTIRQTMNQIFEEGGLAGEDVNSSYRIEEIVDENDPNLKKITINIYARFVSTLKEIKVTLIPTDTVDIVI